MSVARFSVLASSATPGLPFLTALNAAFEYYSSLYQSEAVEEALLFTTGKIDERIKCIQSRIEKEDPPEQRLSYKEIERLQRTKTTSDAHLSRCIFDDLEKRRLLIGKAQAMLPAEWLIAIVQELEQKKQDKTSDEDILKLTTPDSGLGQVFTLERYLPELTTPQSNSAIVRLFLRERRVNDYVKWVVKSLLVI